MIYEIKDGEKTIGTTKFEFGDPSMGFVHGELNPNNMYNSKEEHDNLVVIYVDTDEKIDCASVVIEDYSE